MATAAAAILRVWNTLLTLYSNAQENKLELCS